MRKLLTFEAAVCAYMACLVAVVLSSPWWAL
jgi:hypothetical protein